ncbi:MAG: cytochrome c [Flavobacterium sp.]|uniref:c-type cytochrome n=1 Tax=Flavobacterium sp. TaxID=239 RepID=UPI00260D619E|nr:cytochrome c [Flavobacterium sp.]MDD5149949.1 cytochrome c [Flavobacterium sp.]
MKKIFQYLLMLVVSLMATSCYYDELPPEPVIQIPDSVSYSTDVQPLWDQSCISCHKAGATAPDLTAGNSYAALMANYVVAGNAANSLLHKSLIGQGAPLMPTAGIWSDSKIALVDKWINDGALNN